MIRLGKGTGGFTYLDVGRWYFTFSWRNFRGRTAHHDPFYWRGKYGAWIGPLWIGRFARGQRPPKGV